MNTTGFGSWIAARSRPYVSAGVDGITTLSPGMCASSASRLCECWLPDERPAPNCVRTVSAISRGAAGHERQLRGLVEQLVEAHAEEVEVHELHDRAHARHRRADAEADDRALGDRGVAHAVAEAVVQPARQAEHVAARGDVDPGDEHALVAGELDFERAADRVHRAEHGRVGGGRRRFGPLGAGAHDEVGERRDRGRRHLARGVDRVVELARDRRLAASRSCRRRRPPTGAGARARAAGRAPPTRAPRRRER